MHKVGIVSLGCPRNLVDSEIMIGSLKKEGYVIADEVGEGVDVFIINTCSFVKSAREESIDTILEAGQLKKEGKIKHIIIAGCLPQAYSETLLKNLPEADALVGTGDFARIGEIVRSVLGGKQCSSVSRIPDFLYDENSPRFALTPCHYAYVKISEGCDNLCSYCIISRLRGRFRSRAVSSVIKEIQSLSASGALKEIDIIGQDTTLFGIDLYGKSVLPQLLSSITGLNNSAEWIRILYTHPAHYSDELISAMSDNPKICKYLDIPIQHINDGVLKKMNRHTTKKEIIDLIERIRKGIPGIALRTSIIVGFPGETEKAFKELLDFLKEVRFEKLGAFIYSREEGSRAYKFRPQIPEAVKQQRFDAVMRTQQAISADINRSFLGKTVKVLIDEKLEGDRYFGRTEFDAPEVDGGVYINGPKIRVGEFYKVKIKDTLEYDLVGELT